MKFDTKSVLIGFAFGTLISTATTMFLEAQERRRIALVMEQDARDVACVQQEEEFVCRWKTGARR